VAVLVFFPIAEVSLTRSGLTCAADAYVYTTFRLSSLTIISHPQHVSITRLFVRVSRFARNEDGC
jgi:hypothetical protein